MSRRRAPSAEAVAGWLTLIGAIGLLGSLFLTWSHQLRPGLISAAGNSPVLRGVPSDPTAWQVYSVADVLLVLLAAALLAAALSGARRARIGVLAAAGAGAVFTLHALSVPPSNGAIVLNPASGVAQYLPRAPSAGVGETIALIGLALAIAGLGLSLARE
jgi:hypothetical protein